MRKQTKLWATKNGGKIRICDMSDSHLNNSIALLERIANMVIDKAIQDGYGCLSFIQGEMAEWSIENGIAQLEHTDVSDIFPIYDNLILDKTRREMERR